MQGAVAATHHSGANNARAKSAQRLSLSARQKTSCIFIAMLHRTDFFNLAALHAFIQADDNAIPKKTSSVLVQFWCKSAQN
ncbi:hypothetical protein [Undibacterium curvum]|uniref:hypothetical protein n=1 Tax=Undibacterium curvum TaxID=2762294 RepID=UPI003D116D20